ncbi:MAG: 3-phosphoshikimate 1-carboxyvinyltransferase [Lachnospiraceae bacterium]|nr:3-phosphoshikimate 1-carboxyvinyltransferase [Lachnospiraceae bacterium]
MKVNTYKVSTIYTRLSCLKEHGPLTVTVPGSKSLTNRALLLATLARGTSILRGVLFSDDSRHFLKCVQDLGFETEVNEEERKVTVTGLGGALPKKEAWQYVGSAGTAARFLTAYLGISEGTFHMDASEQMRKRPMAPLLTSLQELGCEVVYEGAEGYFPFTLKGNGFRKQAITVDIEHSSQFLSALLIAACLSPKDFVIHVKGSHGMSYIEITRRMMEQFGVKAFASFDGLNYTIPAGQKYGARDYQIEPDASAAAYFYGMSMILGVPVKVAHITFDSMQGDVAFLRILEKMGAVLTEEPDGILLTPPAAGKYHGVDVDMSSCSDQAITLAALAPFADAPTTIRGIGHIRYQECNRMNAIVTELNKMGICCEETETTITIHPGKPKPSLVDTYDDHRMAMGFSLIGLRADGIEIDNPGCCRKTFENYFECLDECVKELLNSTDTK